MTRLILALACALAIVASSASAQDYPNKPIKLIVSFGPGGGADIVGRILGQSMAEKLGQPVVIENRPGAAGTIGNEAVARADKDGYTLGIMTAGQIIAAVVSKSLRYDTLKAFDPVSQVATASLIVTARPDFPANNIQVVGMTVKPGDKITSSVTRSGTSYTLKLTDSTHPANSFTTTQSCAAATCVDSSAEWIAEAPSGSSGILPLTRFGTWTLKGAAVTAGARSGTITTFPHTKINMVNPSGQVKAQTGALNSAGNQFTVTWKRST